MQVKGVFFGVVIVAAFSVGFGEENGRFADINNGSTKQSDTKPVDNNIGSNLNSQERDGVTTNPSTDSVDVNKGSPPITITQNIDNGIGPQDDKKIKSSSEVEIKKPTLDAISIKLFKAEENGIGISDITKNKQFNYVNRTSMKVFSVDFHIKKALIFYASQDKIFRETFTSWVSTGNATIIEDKLVDGPVSIAVDWVHDKLYWLSIRHSTVRCSSLNGTERTVLIDNLDNTLYPNNIAVDPHEGYIFFVSNHTIYKSTLDGKHLSEVRANGTEGRAVKYVVVDPSKKRLFYTGKEGHYDTGLPYVASCDYEGQNVEEIPLDKTKWNDIYSLSVFRDTLYFTHYPKEGGDTVWSVGLTDKPPSPKKIYATSDQKGGVWSIKLCHPEVQERL